MSEIRQRECSPSESSACACCQSDVDVPAEPTVGSDDGQTASGNPGGHARGIVSQRHEYSGHGASCAHPLLGAAWRSTSGTFGRLHARARWPTAFLYLAPRELTRRWAASEAPSRLPMAPFGATTVAQAGHVRSLRRRPCPVPGCKPVRLPRTEVDRIRTLGLHGWSIGMRCTETAWICEPTTPYHERAVAPGDSLGGADRLGVRGSPIESDGSMDLLETRVRLASGPACANRGASCRPTWPGRARCT